MANPLRPRKTDDGSVSSSTKALLYAHHGWGKTQQCRNYAEAFGPGLILSGESGLSSISNASIDYVSFTSYAGEHDPDKGIYSFRDTLLTLIEQSPKALGYNWIALDSLTEVSDMLIQSLDAEYATQSAVLGKKENTFQKWGDFAKRMIGSMKAIRDLDCHVLVTCLAREESNAQGAPEYWPMVGGRAAPKQIPAIFDCVFGGHREQDDDGVTRSIYTDCVDGWMCKVRDPRNRLPAKLQCDNIADVLKAIHEYDEKTFDNWIKEVSK